MRNTESTALARSLMVIAIAALSGWQYLTLLSPLFVYLLLTRFSGITLLQAQAQRRWREDSNYQLYRDSTPALWPRPPRAPVR